MDLSEAMLRAVLVTGGWHPRWVPSVADAQEKVDAWGNHYHAEGPRRALGNLSPADFVRLPTAAAVEGKTELAVLT